MRSEIIIGHPHLVTVRSVVGLIIGRSVDLVSVGLVVGLVVWVHVDLIAVWLVVGLIVWVDVDLVAVGGVVGLIIWVHIDLIAIWFIVISADTSIVHGGIGFWEDSVSVRSVVSGLSSEGVLPAISPGVVVPVVSVGDASDCCNSECSHRYCGWVNFILYALQSLWIKY